MASTSALFERNPFQKASVNRQYCGWNRDRASTTIASKVGAMEIKALRSDVSVLPPIVKRFSTCMSLSVCCIVLCHAAERSERPSEDEDRSPHQY